MRHQNPCFFILISLIVFSCEDPTMDFTSGSFYPVKPSTGGNTTPPKDTTKDNSTGLLRRHHLKNNVGIAL